MRIGLFSPRMEGTGNRTSADRIHGHFTALGHEVEDINIIDLEKESLSLSSIKERHFDLAVGLHAFRSGQYLSQLGLPSVIVFGGTDLNSDVLDDGRRPILDQAVSNASYLVAFSRDFTIRAEQLWPEARGKTVEIPKGVETFPDDQFRLCEHLGLEKSAEVALLPAALRPVKDPLFLVRSVADWHSRAPEINLVVAGPELDGELRSLLYQFEGSRNGIFYAGVLRREQLHRAMLDSSLVANSSISEGSSNAILESMQLGTPVVARANSGNASLIAHGKTGFLFVDPREFIRISERLITDSSLREDICANAKAFIDENHSLQTERELYRQLLGRL